MSSKKTFLVAVSLISILIVAATPLAKKTEVRISPFGPDEVTIQPGEVGVLRWGWRSCSPGLTMDFINATDQYYVVRKDGQVIKEVTAEQAAKSKNWTEPYVVEGELDGRPIREWCAWPATNAYQATWEHKKLRFKKSGVYELDVYAAQTEPLIDGFAYVTPPLDIYDARVLFDKTIVITVE